MQKMEMIKTSISEINIRKTSMSSRFEIEDQNYENPG